MVVVSSPVVSTTVARVSRYHVFLDWPWKTKDPKSEFDWDGTVAFPRAPDHPDWLHTPWRLETEPWDLNPGDTVELSIPEVDAVVLAVKRLERPRDTGWLPRPVLVLEFGTAESADAGFVLYCDTDEPITISP
ncbi:hypothetical protein V1227_27380 [Lentzea sp. DG1S-22]|uniref:hypothetical protein n=1 Tax=Lentzea sp. DG1S-22 TaxID=3108822 RepID=UPI002E788E2C|nr:hypothetical protein [Lentzea sp. DG1S-22]WVH78760.1 hypothetical protein V1227_27380 [Lentzea sp. DG1S-22]